MLTLIVILALASIFLYRKEIIRFIKIHKKKIVGIGLATTVVSGGLLLYPSPVGADNWINGTSTTDNGNKWANDDNVLDGDTGTYAFTTNDAKSLRVDIDWTISSDKIRIYCARFNGLSEDNPDEIDIEVFDTDVVGWVEIAADQTITANTWTEFGFGQTRNINGGRFHDDDVETGCQFRVKCFQFNNLTSEPPEITITFAGNTSDSGKPYWACGFENVSQQAIEGDYINGSMQNSDNMTVNCTVTGTGTVNVYINVSRDDVWTNGTAMTNTDGNYYEYDIIADTTSEVITFDVYATDDNGNNVSAWRKTGMYGDTSGTPLRRYVTLNCSTVNISYTPYYFIKINETHHNNNDDDKEDRLRHDQGTGVASNDAGYLRAYYPSDTVEQINCDYYLGVWFDESVCPENTTIDNVYFRFWGSAKTTAGDEDWFGWVGWNQSQESIYDAGSDDTKYIDKFHVNQSDNVSQVYYNGVSQSDNFYLYTHLLDITDTEFYYNDIYEFMIGVFNGSDLPGATYPSIISNQSFTSFIMFNVPSDIIDGTDNSTDNDGDGLSDHMEVNTTYGHHTNPFKSDTDNDGSSDYTEIAMGSDPNNYTDTIGATDPEIQVNSPDNNSVDVSLQPTVNITVWDNSTIEDMTVRWYENSSVLNFVLKDTQDDGENYYGIWNDDKYVYTYCLSEGLRVYGFNENNTEDFWLKDYDNTAQANHHNIWGDGEYIYVASYDYGIYAYTFNENGTEELWLKSTQDDGGNYYAVWGDGTYIYTAVGTNGIYAYTFDGSTFTQKDTHVFGVISYSYVWCDNSYIYVAGGSGGVLAYTFNENITEEFWLKDTHDAGGLYYGVFGNSSYIYTACYGDGIRAYTFNENSTEEFWLKNTHDNGGNYNDVWCDTFYIYVACEDNGIYAYSFDGAVFSLEDTRDDGDIYYRVFGNELYEFVTCNDAGIRAYGFKWNCSQTNTSVSSGDSVEWVYTNASSNSQQYEWKAAVNNSAKTNGSDDWYTFTTVAAVAGTFQDIYRTYGEDYIVWLGTNTTAGNAVADSFENITWSSTECIAKWNDTTWNADWYVNGSWTEYHPHNTSGDNFTLNTFTVLKVYITDGFGNQTINMTENQDVNYPDSKTYQLRNNSNNKGFNYSAFNRVTATNLQGVNNSIGLTQYYWCAVWDRTIFEWRYWIAWFDENNIAVNRWDVVETKIEPATDTWVT